MSSEAPYDRIADWYDHSLRDNPLYDEVILPSLLVLAPDVGGRDVIDVACGQGYASRALARLGARVTGIDISVRLLELASRYEESEPLGITYRLADAETLTGIADASFDGAVCNMGLMNIPDLAACAASIARVLRPAGWFVFTLAHPNYQSPRSRWVDLSDGSRARQVQGYFAEGYYETPAGTGIRSRVGEHHRTLSTYVNTLNHKGFVVERMIEPKATGKRASEEPGSLEVPSTLAIRARQLRSH